MAAKISHTPSSQAAAVYEEVINEPLHGVNNNSHASLQRASISSTHGQYVPVDTYGEDSPPVDPQRFTPTLHASLVSEILSLRRDLGLKEHFIEELESALHDAKAEHESLSSKLSDTSIEHRNLSRQFELLERDSSLAIEDLTRDRDRAWESDKGLKHKLDLLGRKIRSQEGNAAQMLEMLEKDKSSWNAERRKLERRLHTSESQLKTALDELSSYHQIGTTLEDCMANTNTDKASGTHIDSEGDSYMISPASRKSSPQKRQSHRRNLSNCSHRKSYGVPDASLSEADGMMWLNGQSLADELSFGEEVEGPEDASDSGDDLTEQELRARRGLGSRQSCHQDDKAKRVLGLTSQCRDHVSNRLDLDDPLLEQDEGALVDTVMENELLATMRAPASMPISTYKDAGVQHSSLTSYYLLPGYEDKGQIEVSTFSKTGGQQDYEMDSADDCPSNSPFHRTTDKAASTMICSASQTPDWSYGSPVTSTVNGKGVQSSSFSGVDVQWVSISTQTDTKMDSELFMESITTNSHKTPLLVPRIKIDPPLSAPSSPKDPVLPPGAKSVGTQILFDEAFTTSVSVQTEEIRVDSRSLKKSYPWLASAFGSEKIVKAEAAKNTENEAVDEASNLLSQERLKSKIADGENLVSLELNEANVTKKKTAALGTHQSNSIPTEHVNQTKLTDNKAAERPDFSTEGSDDFPELRKNVNSRLHTAFPPSISLSRGATLTDEEDCGRPAAFLLEEESSIPSKTTNNIQPLALKNITNLPPRIQRQTTGKHNMGKKHKYQDIKPRSVWRSTLIQSGTNAHLSQHARIPSVGSGTSGSTGGHGITPPFPVPARSSSMGITHCSSDEPQSPTPNRPEAYDSVRREVGRDKPYGKNIRKVQSTAAISRRGRSSALQSRSSPQPSTQECSEASRSLDYHPLETRTSFYPSKINNGKMQFPKSISNGSDAHMDGISIPSVIDAIAATMVGEWMWKYVRKRKSFGKLDNGQEATRKPDETISNPPGNSTRHRRWVWLSPYDRTVMWSSKQPVTEAALMGKANRTRLYKCFAI